MKNQTSMTELVKTLKKLARLSATPGHEIEAMVAKERVRTIQAKYGIKDEDIHTKMSSAYFYDTIQDWGWVTETGKIESGLMYDGPTSHAQLAFRLGYKGYIGAIKAGCIRWGYSEKDSTIYAEYRDVENLERKLERLKEYTGASKVVLDHSGT